MESKLFLVLTALSLATLSDGSTTAPTTAKSCQEDPTAMCILKAMLKPYTSLRCLVNATLTIDKLSTEFEAASVVCSHEGNFSKSAEEFIEIHQNIMKSSEKIRGACASETSTEMKPGISCASKALSAFLNLRKYIQKAASAAKNPEKLESTCLVQPATNYVAQFPGFQADLNQCVFKKNVN